MKKWMKWEEDILIENYPKLGADGCTVLLPGRTKSAIENRAITGLGLKLNSDVRSAITSGAKKTVNVSADQFINIRTKEVAYFLGFLWADGYLNGTLRNKNITVKINTEDAETLMPTLNQIGKWNVYTYKTKWKDSTTITTNNQVIFDYLSDHDYAIKSVASPNKILSKIPQSLQRYFFRGIVDGDGCFYIKTEGGKLKQKQFSVTSTFEQDWLYFEGLCKILNIKYTIQRVKGKTSYSALRVLNKDGIVALGEFIYHEYDNIGLQRKYKKFLTIKEKLLYE